MAKRKRRAGRPRKYGQRKPCGRLRQVDVGPTRELLSHRADLLCPDLPAGDHLAWLVGRGIDRTDYDAGCQLRMLHASVYGVSVAGCVSLDGGQRGHDNTLATREATWMAIRNILTAPPDCYPAVWAWCIAQSVTRPSQESIEQLAEGLGRLRRGWQKKAA